MTVMSSQFSSENVLARPRVAVVGSGIGGLSAAYHLRTAAHTTLFESGDYFGGHTHTVDVSLPNAQGTTQTIGVDTGFLVLNERTYPELLKLFAALHIPLAKSDRPGLAGQDGARVERHQPTQPVLPTTQCTAPFLLAYVV
jgi:predicted NAD/FAD-binding protein